MRSLNLVTRRALNASRRLRTLAVASTFALAALSGPVAQAHAEPKRADTGVRCAVYHRSLGTWEFFLPGEEIGLIDDHGGYHILRCGADGRWVEVRRATPLPVLPVVPVGPIRYL